MLGTLLGDAFGRPLEGVDGRDHRLPGLVERRRRGSDPLGYSDDTEMMTFVAESILECGRVDGDHLLQWMATHHEPARGYGKGTRAAFAAAARGVPASEAGYSSWSEGSKGNGAAVRVTPIACLYVADDESLAPAATASATITHAHPIAVDGAVVMAHATAAVLRTQRGEIPDADSFVACLRPTESAFAEKLGLVRALVRARASPAEAVAALGNGVLAIDSVPLALFSFLRWGPDFEAVVVNTALCGGDIDSIAAMSGALSGALVGEEGLPTRWLARAEDGSRGVGHVSELADQLCAVSMSAGARR